MENTFKTSLRLPAEWEKQSFVQMTWPHSESDWGEYLQTAEPAFTQIAQEISLREKLLIVCSNEKYVASLLKHSDANLLNIVFVELPSNDVWARDHAAITVLDSGEPLLLDFAFNGWGLKYKANCDNQITRKLSQAGVLQNKLRTLGFVLEGGGIESDGQGTILTTSACLLSPNRNPHFSKSQIEEQLKIFLGAQRILWLNHGYMSGDDTDCHIDTLARFCNENTIVYMSCNDSVDEHYAELKLMEEELRSFKTSSGDEYKLLPLPMPQPIFNAEGVRLPATYANFLIINSAVLAPIYGDPMDTVALKVLKEAFPNHEIVPINCCSLILQRGSLHCATMQFPEKVSLNNSKGL